MTNTKQKIIAIVGPTASGKTAVGVKLAKEFNGEIVSADSRQVYRGLDLGTGKEGVPNQKWMANYPNGEYTNEQYSNRTIEQLANDRRWIDGVSQWMIDIAEPGEKFTLFDYLPLARKTIEDILSRGKLPIIVGGTGLYVQALVEGFALQSIQNTDNRIQQDVIPTEAEESFKKISGQARDDTGGYYREQLNNKTVEELQKILQEIDKKSYDELADKKNPHRLIRAIEKAQEGLEVTKKKPDWDVLQIGLEWPREELNKRIDKRVDDRFEEGMLEEVTGLLKSGVDKEWLLSLGLEYRIIGEYVLDCHSRPRIKYGAGSDRESSQDPRVKPEDDSKFQLMKDQLKLKSHQYAKRQMTWFKRFSEIYWERDYKKIEDAVLDFLKK